MKISKIIISNYRAFYSEKGKKDTEYRINLRLGENMLIYGENGSGKSSLYKALKDLFRSSLEADCKITENIFSKDEELEEQPFVAVTFSGDGLTDETYQLSADPHLTQNANEKLSSVARSRSFMTYRDLLRVHFIDNPEVNLFEFLFGSDGLLADMPNPSATRAETKLRMYALWQATIGQQDEVTIHDFTNGVNQIMSDLNNSLNHLLRYFDESISVSFSALSEDAVKAGKPVVKMTVTYFEKALGGDAEEYHNFLNEARLSALAICIFLAAHLSVPAPAYKILFLDDIFTGLDTQNRIPLLNILTDKVIRGTVSETFTDYQVFLSTYDKQWFDLAKNHLGTSNWHFLEMYIDKHSKGFHYPALLPSEGDFEKATHYFRMKQYPACANYQRKICEGLIKRFLPDYKKYDALPNGDIKPVEKLATLIERFESYLIENGLDVTPYNGLKTCLRAFMNPLSHDDGESPAYRKELELGFELIKKLQTLKNTEYIKQGEIIRTQQAHGETGVPYLYEFEVQTSVRVLISDTERKISKLIIRPTKMTKLDDNKVEKFIYDAEPIDKGLKSVCDFLKIGAELDPLQEFTWRNGDSDEPLNSMLQK